MLWCTFINFHKCMEKPEKKVFENNPIILTISMNVCRWQAINIDYDCHLKHCAHKTHRKCKEIR